MVLMTRPYYGIVDLSYFSDAPFVQPAQRNKYTRRGKRLWSQGSRSGGRGARLRAEGVKRVRARVGEYGERGRADV